MIFFYFYLAYWSAIYRPLDRPRPKLVCIDGERVA